MFDLVLSATIVIRPRSSRLVVCHAAALRKSLWSRSRRRGGGTRRPGCAGRGKRRPGLRAGGAALLDEALRRRRPATCPTGRTPRTRARRPAAREYRADSRKRRLVFKDGGEIARRFGEAASSVGAIVDTVVLADAAYYVGYAGLSTFDRTLVDTFRATRDQYDARLARPDNCTFTVGKNKQRGVADHVPNAPAGRVYMRHFRSLP